MVASVLSLVVPHGMWQSVRNRRQELKMMLKLEVQRACLHPRGNWEVMGERQLGETRRAPSTMLWWGYIVAVASNAGSASALRALGMLNRRREAQGTQKSPIPLDLGSHLHR